MAAKIKSDMATDRRAEAEPLFREAMGIRRAALGEAHPNYGACLNNLANLLREMHRPAEAEALFRQALPILRKALGDEHPNTKTVAGNYARLLRAHFPDPALAELEAAFGPEIGR